MGKFTKTDRAGRGIATLFANAGWGIAAIGLLLAVAGAALGSAPGTGGASGTVDLLGRLTASLPGVGLALLGLFSVLMAAQTRAALDTADMTRALLAAAQSTGRAGPLAAPSRARDAEPVPPPSVPAAAPRAADPPSVPATPRAPGLSLTAERPGAKAPARPEPTMNAAAAPKPRPHPIFSAKPPR